jgi:hypothetical protein
MKTLAILLALAAAPAMAQEVGDCDWRARADAVAEPWELNSRTFSNGAVRLALIDTIEPAAMPFHLLVLSPPYDEVGGRQCSVVSYQGGMGFYDIDFAALEAAYDPAVGLIFDLPVQIWVSDGNIVVRRLHVTLNQATGGITASLP